MQLRDDVWLEGAYYIDFDERQQLRVVGPDNHLYFGAVGLYRDDIAAISIGPAEGSAVAIDLKLKVSELLLHDPAMGHIRKVRRYTEFIHQLPPLYIDVVKRHPTVLEPNYIQSANNTLVYRRLYGQRWYGIRIELPESVQIKRSHRARGYQLKASQEISLTLVAESDTPTTPALANVLNPAPKVPESYRKLWDQAGAELEHLVAYRKTSGYAYGTVFPRDWMESADLGRGDITQKAWEFMYQQSLEHVTADGVGWHEDIVGEYQYEEQDRLSQTEHSLDELVAEAEAVKNRIKGWVEHLRQLYITRNMIDIEPRYLVGMAAGGFKSLNQDTLDRLRQIARYVQHQATDNTVMTFKKVPEVFRRHRLDKEYCHDGNWRDSEYGHLMVHPVIAPYDVNVVFYPQALQVMKKHAAILELDEAVIDALITKWDRVKDWFRFTNADGTTAFALALYDIHETPRGFKYKKLKANHTDEAYELFYGDPLETDVVAFCTRLLSPDYFYTKSGPTIVGSNDGYSKAQYHGQVIWTKQTAFVVAGLQHQLEAAAKNGWDKGTVDIMTKALSATAEASMNAFRTFQAFPELYYDDNGTPKFYSDQPEPEGIMNTVQLWSAVGARRIMKAYKEVASNG